MNQLNDLVNWFADKNKVMIALSGVWTVQLLHTLLFRRWEILQLLLLRIRELCHKKNLFQQNKFVLK